MKMILNYALLLGALLGVSMQEAPAQSAALRRPFIRSLGEGSVSVQPDLVCFRAKQKHRAVDRHTMMRVQQRIVSQDPFAQILVAAGLEFNVKQPGFGIVDEQHLVRLRRDSG